MGWPRSKTATIQPVGMCVGHNLPRPTHGSDLCRAAAIWPGSSSICSWGQVWCWCRQQRCQTEADTGEAGTAQPPPAELPALAATVTLPAAKTADAIEVGRLAAPPQLDGDLDEWVGRAGH